jgi:hypothetical protein
VADDSRRYTFNALERRGLFLGMQVAQLATLAGGATAALLVLQLAGGPAGPMLAVLVLAVAAVGALWPWSGRPVAGWLPIAAAWIGRRSRGPAVAGVSGPAPVGRSRRRANPAPSGIDLVEVGGWPGQDALGVLRDLRWGTWTAVVPIQGQSFVLLDPEEQVARLEAWRAVLGTLARPGTPLRRVQWVHRSVPAVGPGLDLPDAPCPGPATSRAQESYRRLVSGPASIRQQHQAWMVLTVGGARRTVGGARRATGGARALDQLRRELRLLDGHLRQADLRCGKPLGLDALHDLLASAYRCRVADRPGRVPRRPWAMASDESWSAWRADSMWHATYWIAEWPRLEVNPDFLTPLLLCEGRRTVSVLMAPVPAERAAREARAARAADLADEELRARAGFLASARRDREATGVLRRETELADGHAEYRFAGYVTVTAGDRDELEAACVETQQAAQRALLELCRLYGRQEEAFTWTLPLGRGLG